jgi:hypothetical protein
LDRARKAVLSKGCRPASSLLVDKYEKWVRDVADHRYAFPTMSLAAGAQARNTSPNHRLARIDFEPEFGRQSRRIQFGFTLR